jgi:hypothetical protein
MDTRYIQHILNKKFVGITVTGHFIERFFQRCTTEQLQELLGYFNTNICMIIYEMELMGLDKKRITVGDTVVITELVKEDHPKLRLVTLFNKETE